MRSAYWTSVVLERIADMIPEFGSHVRIIAGASGGMLGAAYFVDWLKDQGEQSWRRMPKPPTETIPVDSLQSVGARHRTPRDLSSLLATGAVIDRFRKRFAKPEADRGIILENDWSAITFPFQALRPAEAAGQIPSLILSPMIVRGRTKALDKQLGPHAAHESEGNHDHRVGGQQ